MLDRSGRDGCRLWVLSRGWLEREDLVIVTQWLFLTVSSCDYTAMLQYTPLPNILELVGPWLICCMASARGLGHGEVKSRVLEQLKTTMML